MSVSEEKLQRIKKRILEAVEIEVEAILREEFNLSILDINVLVKKFVNEYCSINSDNEISSRKFYEKFDDWCTDNNYGSFSHISFSQALQRQRYPGVRRTRKQEGSFWVGITVNNNTER